MARLIAGYSKKQGNLTLLKESVESKSGDVYLTGIFQIFDEENENGRVYPKDVLLPEVQRYTEEFVKTNRAFGELDHTEDRATIAGERVCHRIVDLWVEGKYVMGKTLILDTTLGREVKAMLHNGGVLGVSSRSLGVTDNRNHVKDLYLICWDIVSEPSVSVALMERVNETKNIDLDYFKKMQRRLNKKRYFTTLNESNNDIETTRREILKQFRKYFINI